MKTVAPFEVGITVKDLDALLPFYTEVLGFSVYSDLRVTAEKSRPTGLSPTGYRVVRLETNLGNRFKLAQPVAPPEGSAPAAFALQKQGGAYVTFIVEGLQSLHERLQENGARILSDGVVQVRPGLGLLLAHDPEGNQLEFVEYEDLDSYLRPASR